MFLGTHTPKLDEKGRLILPAKFRDDLAGGLVVTRGQENCAVIYPRAVFDEVAAKAHAAPQGVKANRDYARMLTAAAWNEIPDKQGRITIPGQLRTYAGLDRDCVVIGLVNRLELWNAAAWQSYEAEQEAVFASHDDGAPADG